MMYVLPALRYEVLCAHPGLLEQGSTFSPEIEELQFDCFPQRPRCCSQGALFVEIACSVGTLSAYKPRPERRQRIGKKSESLRIYISRLHPLTSLVRRTLVRPLKQASLPPTVQRRRRRQCNGIGPFFLTFAHGTSRSHLPSLRTRQRSSVELRFRRIEPRSHFPQCLR